VLAFDRFCRRLLLCALRSALFEMGNTRVIAAVYGPREVITIDPYSD
jgi:ribonuclease PH